MTKTIITVISFLFIVSAAQASTEIAGVEVDGTFQSEAASLSLNGAGARSKAFIKLYVGALYLAEKSENAEEIIDADADMAIKLTIVSGMISSKKMLEATSEGFEKATDDNTSAIENEIKRFNVCFSEEINKKDVFDMAYVPGKGVMISKNGTLKDTIEGMEFKKALFGIWLCDKPADKKLKKAMLGK